MKIYGINLFNLTFQGKRQDRKTVSQLKQDNPYDLNVINQRRISQAISNLAEVPGEDNVKFLLDVSENLKYGTGIDLGKTPYNDWQIKLNNAAKKSLSLSDENTQKLLKPHLDECSNKQQLNKDELEILNLRKSVLANVEPEKLKTIKNDNTRNLSKNLDYFIVSSEVPLSQKLYIMKRLNYFMSPDYKINEQLKDKKTQALAEIVNDIVVDTPESDIPNIKAINQKSHGMCAAISICRKNLAYEDKANYVDMVMSELDDSEYLQVYDITKLGSHTKIPVEKANIDFDYALSKGYRIVDTSALYWMHIGNTAGAANEFVGMYNPFDRDNFDTFSDSHLLPDLSEDLVNKQDWYRTLNKAKSVLASCKKQKIKRNFEAANAAAAKKEEILLIEKYNNLLKNILREISPNLTIAEIREIANDLQNLQVPNSEKAKEVKNYKKDFVYLPNESKAAKSEKIKAFLTIALADGKNTKLLDKKIPEILSLLDDLNSAANIQNKPSAAAMRIRRAKNLYNAASAYRTQQLFQLDIPEQLTNMIITAGIPDSESIIIRNMDLLIKKLEKGSINRELRKVLAKNFESEDDNEALLESLKGNRETINYILTDALDDLYHCSLSVNRKTVLLNELSALRDSIKIEKDKDAQANIAFNLHVKNDKKTVLDILDKYIEILQSENCSENQYITIYNNVGKKSQLKDFKAVFERLGVSLFEDEYANENIIQGFNLINGLPKDASREETIAVYNKIGQLFNNLSGLISGYQNALDVRNSRGEVLNTVNGKELVIKKLENMHDIVSAKDLELLRNKFILIEKASENPDGSSVKVKDLPEELTQFTPHEKEILNSIESNINNWYSVVDRALDFEYRELKEPLEELNRQVGIKTGQNWVSSEGHSGLASFQQIRIIEHMTDRPYYIENNPKYAIGKIKNAPYSGISCTSVDNSAPSLHAQYIVDVKPVETKSGDKTEIKDALFHDNTWGAVEHENLWHDENGFLRTDYSNGYGGENGYITDENYRSGKLLENLIGATGELKRLTINNKNYNKLSNKADGYKFPMFYDVITPGRYPNPDKYVRMIRENTLLSPIQFFPKMEDYARNMTTREIKSVIKKAQTLGYNIDNEYYQIQQRIFGNEPLIKGIKTIEDYNKLPVDDKLKILLEKIALIRSYSGIPDTKIFYNESTADDLERIKKSIKTEARKNFDYTFAKNIDITRYGAESVRYKLYEKLDKFASENNIKLTQTQKTNMVNSLKNINKEEFNGSLNKTVELMTSSFENYMQKKLPDFESKGLKIKDLADDVRNMLKTNMVFTLNDLNSSSFDSDRLKCIAKWIDDIYDPATDEEFVQIFNNIQNMTNDEFKEKFESKITDETIGIKRVSGFDILTQYRSLDERTENLLFNTLYNQKLGYDIKMSKTTATYEYGKLSRTLRGAKYSKNQRTFDDIYLDYYYSLMLLTVDKRFNKFKKTAFDKYGIFPAYPKTNPESKEDLDELIRSLYNDINSNIEAVETYKSQQETINLIKNLSKYVSKVDDSKVLTTGQYNHVINKIKEFLKENGEDSSIETSVNAANQILTLGSSATAAEYKNLIKIMNDELTMYATTVDGMTMNDAANESVKYIDKVKKDFVENIIEPKYQKKAYELLNKWISAKRKNKEDADMYFAELNIFFDKHRITLSPEKMLNEYLLLLASDRNKDKKMTDEDIECFETIKNTYGTNVQAMLINANFLEMQYILMSCAKDANLNIVRDEFKHSKLPLRDGTVVTMDSDIALSILLSSLFADTDLDSAVMFIEQLGLGERVIEMAAKPAALKPAYNYVKRINSIFASVAKQSEIVEKELNKIGNIDKDPDYLNKINAMRENVIRKFKNTNFKMSAKLVDKAFEDAISQIKEYPERSKTAFLHLHMENAKDASIIVAKANVDKLNNRLKELQRISNLIERIKLPKNSPAEELRKKYFEEFHNLEEFISKYASKHYESLNLSTGNNTEEE